MSGDLPPHPSPEAAALPLLVQDHGAVRVLTLNRPEALNALNMPLKEALAAALKAAQRDSAVRCVVLTGAGRAFCSGQDLRERVAAEGGSVRDSVREVYNPLIVRLRTMEKPVIAAVNGVAAGAGCSLALACDLRVAAPDASFIMAFVRIGLIPDSGATFLLPRLVGLAKALELAITGDPVDATTAQALGLVARVAPSGGLLDTTMELAHRLAAAPTRAIGLTKRAINRALSLDLEAALSYEADLQEIASRTHDFHEGIQAFAEKRPPHFTGN